jgi:two-component system sensor histidine kinase EvgS
VSATSGTGLGLEVCKSLCELIRGKLKYRRNGKKGSVFFVEFTPRPREAQALRRLAPQPLAAVMAAPPAEREFLGEADDQEKLHVLIVDDSSVNVMVLTKLLTKRLGVEEALCSSAADGFAGLQYCLGWCRDGGSKPLLVFMDREMPGMNGEACARHWRQMEQTFGVKRPAYIVASSAGQDSMRDCNERLDKPIQLVQLSNIVSSVLRNLRGNRQQ